MGDGLTFEWDRRKASANARKHAVTFEEATTVFGDPLSLTVPDPVHGQPSEERSVTIGLSLRGKVIVVVHCDRGDRVRVISARPASARERRQYEEEGI